MTPDITSGPGVPASAHAHQPYGGLVRRRHQSHGEREQDVRAETETPPLFAGTHKPPHQWEPAPGRMTSESWNEAKQSFINADHK